LHHNQSPKRFKMTHDFIINTENVNEYGSRILTAGIDYKQYLRNPVVLFMHDRDDDDNRGSEVIGRCLKLSQKGTDLIATIEFDEKDEFAQKIAGKVERGYIRMASLSVDVKETSSESELVLASQILETITKCKLVEISIVDIGGNDDALKLSKNGKPIQLQKINLKKENMSQFKTVALALGIVAESTEDTVVGKVQEMKLAKETAEKEVNELKVKLSAITTSEATTLVDKAITLGLFPEVLKDSQLKSFVADFDGQKAVLSKMITDKEAEIAINGNHNAIKNVLLSAKGGTATSPETGENSFDYLQKHNVVELARIRDNEPVKYEQLAKDYASGVRYVK
jgi:Caudovirus prohead serine protease